MRKLSIILSIAICGLSCKVAKQLVNKTQSDTTNLSSKASNATQVIKSDSSGIETTQATGKQKIESGYKKLTTTVVEWFSDEFSEGDSLSSVGPFVKGNNKVDTIYQNANPGPIKKANTGSKLIKRNTTTIEEEGFKNALNEAAMINEKTAKLQNNDSLSEEREDQELKSTSQVTNQSWKMTFSLIPFWVWLLFIIIIGCGIYLKATYF